MLSFFQRPALVHYFNLGLLALVLLPLVVLAYYNHPSPADDYCYIDTVQRFGYWEAQKYYYDGWSGRYFAYLLNHSNPLLFHWYAGFKVWPVVLMVGLLASLFALIRQATGVSSLAAAGYGSMIFCLFILKIPVLSEFFYWTAASSLYTVGSILILTWLLMLARWYGLPSGNLRNLTAVFIGFLTFAIVGSCEPLLLVLAVLLGSIFVYRCATTRKIDPFLVGILAIAGVSFYLFFSAPGNALRLNEYPDARKIPFSVVASFSMLGSLVGKWVSVALLAFSVWFLTQARALVVHPNGQARAIFAVHPAFAGVVYVGIMAAQVFTAFYGTNTAPTTRVLNAVYLFFLVGWFYNILVWVSYYHQTKPALRVAEAPVASKVLLAVLIVYGFRNSSVVKMIYNDALRGSAAQYDREMTARRAQIVGSSAKVIYLQPLTQIPESLFVEDLKPNPKHWWNRCMASYYGKEIIIITDQKK